MEVSSVPNTISASDSPASVNTAVMNALPNVMLLTDIPPCQNLTAGIVLHQLCRFIPIEKLSCFAVVHQYLDAKLDPELAQIPYQTLTKPAETNRLWQTGSLAGVESYWRESYTARVTLKETAQKIARFATEVKADKIWCVLQGQTMIRLATMVSEAVGKPLLTQVWDPPEWWLKDNKVDAVSSQKILKLYDETLRKSQCCAAISQNMADAYRELGCNAILLYPGQDKHNARPAAQKPNDSPELLIGIAGQLYAQHEFRQLVEALDSVDWCIAGRNVRLRIMGRSLSVHTAKPMRIEYFGWLKTQDDTIQALSECDVLYCPSWFDKGFEKMARHSFPSKLTSYLASGRPVICHAPEYAACTSFLKSYNATIACSGDKASELVDALNRLIAEPALYAEIARNGRRAFDENLTHERMRQQFYAFLNGGISE